MPDILVSSKPDPEEGVDELLRETCPDCYSLLKSGCGGGVVCSKTEDPLCRYWFCF